MFLSIKMEGVKGASAEDILKEILTSEGWRILSTFEKGKTYCSPLIRVSRPSMMERVSGSSMEIVVPWPRTESTVTSPRISWILLRTTSMPTPRPETSEIFSEVENPLAKMRLRISFLLSLAPDDTSPFSVAFFIFILFNLYHLSISFATTLF